MAHEVQRKPPFHALQCFSYANTTLQQTIYSDILVLIFKRHDVIDNTNTNYEKWTVHIYRLLGIRSFFIFFVIWNSDI